MPLELFADNFSATVSAGGTGAPAAGTSESWTLNVVTGTMPAASSSATPKTAFRIWDPAVPGEWMQVTNVVFVSGVQWTATVIRGTEGTVAAHTAGFTVWQVTTAGWLNGMDTRYGLPNIKTVYGAKGDVRTVTDGAMTNGSATLTCATSTPFTAADVGKSVQVMSATTTAFRLSTTIASVTNGTTIVLAVPCDFTQTAQTIVIPGGAPTFGDSVNKTDAVTTANSTTVTSATAAFTAAMAGRPVTITGARAASLITTISAFTSSSVVTLAASATRTTSGGVQVVYGTDDQPAFAAACVSGQGAYVPPGTYFCSASNAGAGGVQPVASGVQLRGDGWGVAVIRAIPLAPGANAGATEIFGISTWTGGTTSAANNTRGILVQGIHFQGTTTEDGFSQNVPNYWSVSAVSDITWRDCKFSNFNSDAIYVGCGTQTSGVERHNQRVKILNCVFDGTNCDNRNAISIIEGDDVLIDGCSFMNVARDNMPGAIDIEPNVADIKNLVQGIRVTNNYFTAIGGSTGVIGMALTLGQGQMSPSMNGIEIRGNTVLNCPKSTGLFLQQKAFPGDALGACDITVADNQFINLGNNCWEIEGIKGLKIERNFFDACGSSGIVGFTYACADVQIRNNTFIAVPTWGSYVHELIQASRVVIDSNIYDFSGSAASTNLIRFQNGSALGVPSSVVATPVASGGSLSAGTKGYRVSALRGASGTGVNETLASTEVTCVTVLNGQVTLTWTGDVSAQSFNVYGRTSAAELLMTNVPNNGTTSYSFTDTGSITPAGALPGSDTSAKGYTDRVQFSNNIMRQGSGSALTNIASTAAGHTDINSNYFGNNPSSPTLATATFKDLDQALSGDFTTSSVTAVATNLSFPVAPGEKWAVDVFMNGNKATSATGAAFAVGAPAGTTMSGFLEANTTTVAAVTAQVLNTINTLGAAVWTQIGGTNFCRMHFTVVAGAAAGSITIQAATVTSNTLTIWNGSYLHARRVTAQ
jgi:hypothetical protein